MLVPGRVLGVDRRDGPRHVRPDDWRQRVDDDPAVGHAAPPGAVGDVGGDDDRDDAAVRRAHDPARRDAGHPGPVALGYLVVWALFSVGATALQWAARATR